MLLNRRQCHLTPCRRALCRRTTQSPSQESPSQYHGIALFALAAVSRPPPRSLPSTPSPLALLARPVSKTAGSDHGLLAESHGYLMLPFKSFVPQPSSCFPLLLCHLSSQSPSLCVCSLFFPVDPFFSFSSLHFDRAGTRRLSPLFTPTSSRIYHQNEKKPGR